MVARQLCLELLRRVLELGMQDRFQLRDLFPTKLATYGEALDDLIESALVERVSEGVGRWFYQLTLAGKEAATTGHLPKLSMGKAPMGIPKRERPVKNRVDRRQRRKPP